MTTAPDPDPAGACLVGCCAHCGGPFTEVRRRGARRLYCSRSCKERANYRYERQTPEGEVVLPCGRCGCGFAHVVGRAGALPKCCPECKHEKDKARNVAYRARLRPASKPCRSCGVEKPLAEFGPTTNVCTVCAVENRRAAQAAYGRRPENRERDRLRAKARHEWFRDYRRKYRARDDVMAAALALVEARRIVRAERRQRAAEARDVACWLRLFEYAARRTERSEALHASPAYIERVRAAKVRARHRKRARDRENVTPQFIRRSLRKHGWIGPHQPVPPALYAAMRPLLLLRRELNGTE